MPNYDYRCPDCGHSYTQFQKITDATRAKCPECGTRGERVISGGAGLIFKGSGFYITDYKKSGEPAEKGEKGEKKEACEKKSAAENKSEAKPDRKADSKPAPKPKGEKP